MIEDSALDECLGRNVLICAGGSIGVAFLPTIISHLRAAVPDIDLRVAMTKRASRVVPRNTLAVLTGHPVYSKWKHAGQGAVPHMELTQWAELILVMPATGDLLAKAAAGIADDLVTTILLAGQCPTVFVPSMNEAMWKNSVVGESVTKLRRMGRHVLEPAEGVQLSTGYVAPGALPPLRDLLQGVLRVLTTHEARLSGEVAG